MLPLVVAVKLNQTPFVLLLKLVPQEVEEVKSGVAAAVDPVMVWPQVMVRASAQASLPGTQVEVSVKLPRASITPVTQM